MTNKNVPREPDDAMQLAGAMALSSWETTHLNRIWSANKVFRAMHDAAPVESEQARDAGRRIVFDPDLYEMLLNAQNGIRTKIDKSMANMLIIRIDEARAAMSASGAPAAAPAGKEG